MVDGSVYDQSQMGQGGFGGLSIGGSLEPVVAYARSGFPGVGTWQLVRNAGLGPAVLVDADADPFEPFAAPSETAVNTRGDVAFVSSPTVCNDGDPDTVSFCANEECVGMPLPVPEPGPLAGALAAVAGLAGLGPVRRISARCSAEPG